MDADANRSQGRQSLPNVHEEPGPADRTEIHSCNSRLQLVQSCGCFIFEVVLAGKSRRLYESRHGAVHPVRKPLYIPVSRLACIKTLHRCLRLDCACVRCDNDDFLSLVLATPNRRTSHRPLDLPVQRHGQVLANAQLAAQRFLQPTLPYFRRRQEPNVPQ